MEDTNSSKTMKIAYTITQSGERSFWRRVGVAFTNRDGSINVKLDALPTNGQLQLREQRDEWDSPRPRREGAANSEPVEAML